MFKNVEKTDETAPHIKYEENESQYYASTQMEDNSLVQLGGPRRLSPQPPENMTFSDERLHRHRGRSGSPPMTFRTGMD